MEEYSDDVAESTSGGWKAALMKERRANRLGAVEATLRRFSPSERVLLYMLSAILGLSTLILLAGLNTAASVVVPAHGGTLIEGEIGPARFINPLLTISQPDQDLTALIYSGLMRALPDGTLVPEDRKSTRLNSSH